MGADASMSTACIFNVHCLTLDSTSFILSIAKSLQIALHHHSRHKPGRCGITTTMTTLCYTRFLSQDSIFLGC
jgi:hypothetical protein